MTLNMSISSAMGIGALAGKLKAGLPIVCIPNLGNIGGAATGYQGSPTQADFEPYWPEDGLAYLGISPSEPSTFYTGFIRVGPLNVAKGATVTASLKWNTDPAYPYQAYKVFTFRVYAVKDSRSAQVSISNLPTAQVLTSSFVEVNLATWAGASDSTYWIPSRQDIDVSPLVTEVAGDPCFVTNNYLQFIFVPVAYPFGQGYITFGGQGLGRMIDFTYSV